MPKRPAIPLETVRQILIESGHRCAVCGIPTPTELAHIVPWCKSRDHKPENLVCLCANCHGQADGEEWGEKTLREYKAKPWVLRQFDSKSSSDNQPASSSDPEYSTGRSSITPAFPNQESPANSRTRSETHRVITIPLDEPIALGDPLYIDRAADEEVLAVARLPGKTLVIKAPRKMGKSSLLIRFLSECQRAGKLTVSIDFSGFAETELADYNRFLSLLANQIRQALEIDNVEPLVIQSQSEMTGFLELKILDTVQGNLVLAFDNADRILGRSYQSDFFTMLRSWCDSRARSKRFKRMDLALVISSEPKLLIRDAYRSVFDTPYSYELRPFNNDECIELNHRYSELLEAAQVDALRGTLKWTPFVDATSLFQINTSATDGFQHAETDGGAG